MGMGAGRGAGMGKGRGAGGRAGAGPVGECVCPSCGYRMPHTPGIPCRQMRCPRCGMPMVRA
ncbi:MAG: hypothetical protein FE041_00080 [Thermoplasmata archaeon]|nr:MAG: hypothetical protein FE041_00080 [Thermoplasmata archaeon]